MLYTVLAVVLILFLACSAWYNRHHWTLETERVDDLRLLLEVTCQDRDLYRQERDEARSRLATIRAAITRRPPRRKWLSLAYRVAKLTS